MARVVDRVEARRLVIEQALNVPHHEIGRQIGDGDFFLFDRIEQAIAGLLARYGPMSAWGPDAIAEVFLHDVDPAVARDSESYQGAPGAGMFAEPWPLEAWPEVPTRVLVPRGDRLFPLDFQRRVTRERLGLQIDEMDGGHVPMLSRPRELAQRLVELAQAR